MVDPLQSPSSDRSRDISALLTRPDVMDALKKGDVYDILKLLPSNITLEDLKQYFQGAWRTYMSQIVQDTPVYASSGEVPPPSREMFSEHHSEGKMSSDEGAYFMSSISETLSKGLVTKGAGGEATGQQPTGPLSSSELGNIASGTLGDWQQFVSNTMGTILDAQMMSDYKNKMAEVQKEVEKLVELAREGAINPEFVLIALAKVNSTKNGVLMTWLGREAFNLNESLNNITNSLHGPNATDYAHIQTTQLETQQKSYQMQFLVSDMQKVMQDVEGVLGSVKGLMEEMVRSRQSIVARSAAQSSL